MDKKIKDAIKEAKSKTKFIVCDCGCIDYDIIDIEKNATPEDIINFRKSKRKCKECGKKHVNKSIEVKNKDQFTLIESQSEKKKTRANNISKKTDKIGLVKFLKCKKCKKKTKHRIKDLKKQCYVCGLKEETIFFSGHNERDVIQLNMF